MTQIPTLKLPCAYSIVSVYTSPADARIVVLCRLPDNRPTPFATWRVDSQGYCHWGHYARTLEEAKADFLARAADSLSRVVPKN